MATSLAASIESAFNLRAGLIEGHDGIYEVSVENEIVYSNFSQCKQGGFSAEQIVEEIGQFIGVKPKQIEPSDSDANQDQAPACSLPNHKLKGDNSKPLPMFNSTDSQSDCGCSPADSSQSSNSCGCSPKSSSLDKNRCC
jgi:hypothetical protein